MPRRAALLRVAAGRRDRTRRRDGTASRPVRRRHWPARAGKFDGDSWPRLGDDVEGVILAVGDGVELVEPLAPRRPLQTLERADHTRDGDDGAARAFRVPPQSVADGSLEVV